MTTMTHAKYDELQKKMDKLADEYIDVMAEIESNEEEMTSDWLDTHMAEIIKWAKNHDAEEKVLAELRSDYFKLKGMLLC